MRKRYASERWEGRGKRETEKGVRGWIARGKEMRSGEGQRK